MKILASRNTTLSAETADDENVRLTDWGLIRIRESAAMAVLVNLETINDNAHFATPPLISLRDLEGRDLSGSLIRLLVCWTKGSCPSTEQGVYLR